MLTVYSLSPKDASLSAEIANTYGTLGKYDKAIMFADRTIELAPENHWGYIMKAICQVIGMGDVSSAKRTLKECPIQDSGVIIWAWYYFEKLDRDYEAALRHLRRLDIDVIRMQSGFLPVRQLEGHIYRLMGEHGKASESFGDALVILEKAVMENPEDPRVLSSLGYTYAGLGMKEEAISSA